MGVQPITTHRTMLTWKVITQLSPAPWLECQPHWPVEPPANLQALMISTSTPYSPPELSAIRGWVETKGRRENEAHYIIIYSNVVWEAEV